MTEEKTSIDAVAQVIFRPSSECRGYYRFHYGYLATDGTFSESTELGFLEFLNTVDAPPLLAASFVEELSASEMEVCRFGYLLQDRFDDFMRCFVSSCDAVQLYPGMLVLSFNKKENEG